MNIRPRPRVGGNPRLFDVHLPPAQPPNYFTPQFAMGATGCILPQQDYYFRLPYYQYPQYTQYPSYLGYPGPGNEMYRMVTPQAMLPPNLGLYQGLPPIIPPGINMIRPQPWPMPPPIDYGLPGVYAQQNNQTRSFFYDQSATLSGRPRSQEAAGQSHATATLNDATSQHTFNNGGQRNVSHKTRWKPDHNRYKSTQQLPHKKRSFSKMHRRNTASQRLRKLSAKKSKRNKDTECKNPRSPNSSEPFEISSILKEDDDNYETCEEEEVEERKTFSKSIFPFNFFTQKKSETTLDYTLITNDKSFSCVNNKPRNVKLTKQKTNLGESLSATGKGIGKCFFMEPFKFENNHELDVNSNSKMTNRIGGTDASLQNQNSTGFWDESIQCNNNNEQSFLNISMTDQPADDSANRIRLSAFSNISNHGSENNNNFLGVNQTGLWWDKSTDVGYKGIQSTETLSFENGHPQKDSSAYSSGSNQPYIQEIKGFVVVDTAYKRKDIKTDPPIPEYLVDDPNNNDLTSENSNLQTKKSCLQSNDNAVASESFSGLKKLNVNWQEIRKVVPQEYLRRSYTNAGSVQYDLGSSSRQASFLQDSSMSTSSENRSLCDNLPPVSKLNLNADKISDQDDAIVAVIQQVDCLNLNASFKRDPVNSPVKISQNNDSLLHSSIHPSELTDKSKLIKLPTVLTPNAGSSWGKQDVNMLLIVSTTTTALTSSAIPCVNNSSTPSATRVLHSSTENKTRHFQKSLPVNKLISQLTPIHHKDKIVKSLPATPIHSTVTKVKNSKPLAKYASMVNLASFTTVGGSFSSVDFDIDCKKFNSKNEKVSTPHSKVFKTIPFTAQKTTSKCENSKANSTYLLTPASSQLQYVLSTTKSHTAGSISGKHQTKALTSDKTTKNNPQPTSRSQKNSKNKKHATKTGGKVSRPCKLPVSSNRICKPVIKAKCHPMKSTMASPTSSVNTLTPPTTPKALETFVGLGPYGSKTITKQKKRLSTATRNNNARRSLTTSSNETSKKPAKKSVGSSAIVCVSSDSNKNAENKGNIDTNKSGISTSKFIKKTPKLASSKSTNFTSSTSSIVSTKPPNRRSPRTMHNTLSAVNLPDLRGGVPRNLNQKSKSCSRLARAFEDHTNPESKTTKQSARENESVVNTSTSTISFTTLPSTVTTPYERMANSGNVAESTIRSIVPTLSNQPELQKKDECPSPSYLTIRDQYVKKFINWKKYNKTSEVSTVKSLTSSFVRPNSLPSSPTQQPSFSSFQRSASLSDVFYDTASESSYIGSMWNSNRNGNTVAIKLNSLQNWNRTNKTITSCTEATYISYTPPTISPQASDAIKIPLTKKRLGPIQFKMTNSNLDQGETNLSGMAHTGAKMNKPSQLSDQPDNGEMETNGRVRLLSEDLEKEIRQKAELLVESVNESISALTIKTTVKEENISVDKNCPGKMLAHKFKSMPLLDAVGNNSVSKPLHLTKSMEKLNVPPKKPPRSNSPNLVKNGVTSTTNSSNQSSKMLSPNNQPAKSNSLAFQHYPGPPVIPYYPLITAYPGLSPHRHPHFLSPALIPYTYGQHFLWNLQQQHASSMEQYDSEISISHNSENSDQSSDKNESNQLGTYTLPPTAFLAQPPLVVPIEEHLRLQNSMTNTTPKVPTILQKPGAYYLHQKPKYPSMPRPKGTPSKKLAMRRRRSFSSGINSLGVGKARLNRHVHANIKYLTANRAMKLNQIFNSSHPLPRPTRRPRFVRSSLTEDSVFQTMQPKSNKFFTKPLVPKPPRLDTDVQHTMSSVDKGVVNSETETGYHSSTASSSTSTPEKNAETFESTKGVKRTNLKEKETKLAAIPEDSVQTNFNLPRTSENTIDTSHQQEVMTDEHSDMNDMKGKGKNRSKYSKFKNFKKLWNSKKTPKQLASQSQTDFRAIEQPTTSTLKRSSTDSKLPPITNSSGIHKKKHDLTKTSFHWKKQIEKPHQSNDSTLKAETSGHNSYRVQNPNNPGYRPSYDIKLALLKPSFVGIAPSEIKVEHKLVIPEDLYGNMAGRTDNLSDTIQPSAIPNRRNIATTPGVRINSETGDFLEEERNNGAENDPKTFKFLSSTVIDDGIVHAPLHNDEKVVKALAELEEATSEKYVRTLDRPNQSKKSKKNSKFMKNRNRRLSTEI